VFVADGAGGFLEASDSLRRALAEEGRPLCVETFYWSHGTGRILADQIDAGHARQEGQQLACQIAAYRQRAPQSEIYLVGHSAGTGVALAAAEGLPPGSVDRIVLLAPAVSREYDLRPALRTARGGIDVFVSQRDVGYLGLATAVLGTADRTWSSAAGRVGFRPQVVCPEDFSLFAKLRQHPWNPCVEWTGNHGGHYGTYEPRFLHAYVLPLLTPVSR